MDHNPFISRNNDLFIMLVMGMSFHFANLYVFPLSIQSQFLVILAFSFLSGLFMTFLYQSLEWSLFFILGIQAVALSPLLGNGLLSQKFQIYQIVQTAIQTGHYSFFLLSSWIVGIPTGFLLQKLIMADYYKRRSLN